jgi:hypothetical protein
MEPMLEPDCDIKSEEDKDTSLHSGTNTNSDKNDITDTTCTNFTQWTIYILHRQYYSSQVYRHSQWIMMNRGASHY